MAVAILLSQQLAGLPEPLIENDVLWTIEAPPSDIDCHYNGNEILCFINGIDFEEFDTSVKCSKYIGAETLWHDCGIITSNVNELGQIDLIKYKLELVY